MKIEKIIVEVAIPKGFSTTMDDLVQHIDDAMSEATSNGISYEVYKEPVFTPSLLQEAYKIVNLQDKPPTVIPPVMCVKKGPK